MYLKEFEIRWNDLDANRHLANTAYFNLMNQTRMSYMEESGFGHHKMVLYGIGPIVFYEHIHYFREVLPGKPLRVSLELKGLSKEGMYFSFVHNFYDDSGNNMTKCEMMGAWMNLKTRKLIEMPPELFSAIDSVSKTKDFKVLTKEDTRRHKQYPKPLG